MDVLTIQADEVTLQAIKEITRPRYEKLWKDFKQFTGEESLNFWVPSEDEILNFVRHLRDDKGIFNCICNIFIVTLQEWRAVQCGPATHSSMVWLSPNTDLTSRNMLV